MATELTLAGDCWQLKLYVSVCLCARVRACLQIGLSTFDQGFGVGAFELADDDVYQDDDMSNYDQTMGASDQADPFYGWSGSHDQHLGELGSRW